ncbi:unnamed protein product [Phytomonas sp. Hart1]|nr:unnamed protein product [Phytomonas sp. Hart1]|eukprot:CCW66364.1 unnamed protein product [Phytomonas sp. isolate Hart1]
MSAESVYRSAEKKVNGFFFNDYEGAQELFDRAATLFKLEKNYTRAGEAFMRAGDCAVKLKDYFSSGKCFADSANAYKKVDMKKANEMLDIAVKVYMDGNQLDSATRLIRDFAETLAEQGATMEAIPYYERAMRYFDAEDQKAQSQKCMIAMAGIYGENDHFEEALRYYECIANDMVSGPMKFKSRDYYVRAVLCRLALVSNDNRFEKTEECRDALGHYLSSDIYLKNSREYEFLELLLDAVSDCDVDKFSTATSMLHEMRQLDDWKTHVLLVIKHNMESIA